MFPKGSPEKHLKVLSRLGRRAILSSMDPEIWYHQGVACIKVDLNSEIALCHFNRAIELAPRFKKALMQRGLLLARLDCLLEAIDDFSRVIQLDADCQEAWYHRGCVRVDLEEFSEANNDFEQAINIHSDYKAAWISLASLMSSMKLPEKAIVAYSTLVKLDPGNVNAWNELGCLLSDDQQYRDAIKAYERALALKSQEPVVWKNLSNAQWALGSCDLAIISVGKAINLNPKQSDYFVCRGQWLSSMGRVSEAQFDFQKAAKIICGRGVLLASMSQQADAIASYDEALRLDLNYFYAWHLRGVSKAALGWHSEAITDFERALALKPGYTEAQYYRGLSRASLGMHSSAIADFEIMMARDPNNKAAWYACGRSQAAVGEHEKAIHCFDQSVSLMRVRKRIGIREVSSDDESDVSYAVMTEQHRAIVENFRKKESLVSVDESIFFARGFSHAALDQLQEALGDYTQAIAMNPMYAEALYRRGSLRNYQGFYEEALHDFELVLSEMLEMHQAEVERFQEVANGFLSIEGGSSLVELVQETVLSVYQNYCEAWLLNNTADTDMAIQDLEKKMTGLLAARSALPLSSGASSSFFSAQSSASSDSELDFDSESFLAEIRALLRKHRDASKTIFKP